MLDCTGRTATAGRGVVGDWSVWSGSDGAPGKALTGAAPGARRMNLAGRALFATILVEAPWVAFSYPGRRLRLTGAAAVANVFTNILLNVVLPRIDWLGAHWRVIGEWGAFGIEAAVYGLVDPRRDWPRAVVVSGIGNALSLQFGGVLARAIWG